MSFNNGVKFKMTDTTVAAVFGLSGRRSAYSIESIGEGEAVYFSLVLYRQRNGVDRTPRQMESALRSAISKCRRATGRTFMLARYQNEPDDGFMIYRNEGCQYDF